MEAVPHAEGAVIEMREGEELVYRATKGMLIPHAGLRVPLHGSLAGSCPSSGEPLLVPDVLEDPRVKRDLVDASVYAPASLVPVSRAGQAVGVLKLQSSRRAAFTAGDLKLAQILAGTVSAGLAEVGETTARREAEDRLRRERRRLEGSVCSPSTVTASCMPRRSSAASTACRRARVLPLDGRSKTHPP